MKLSKTLDAKSNVTFCVGWSWVGALDRDIFKVFDGVGPICD